MSASYLERSNAPKIAYIRQNGPKSDLPTVVFLHGYHSDMMGTKAQFLAAWCEARGQNFLRFDYSGHGQSEGKFEDGTIGSWAQDALDAVDRLTTGKILLVGSSMGGWLAFLTALSRPKRVMGLIGLAAAPDFTRWMQDGLSKEDKHSLIANGYFLRPSDYGEPYKVTKKFLDDGDQHCLLDMPIRLFFPVRLLQGMKDDDVPWQTAHRIANAISGEDKKVFLLEGGDHRLSRDEDLKLLGQQVAELSDTQRAAV